MKNLLKPVIIAWSIALYWCSDSEQTEKIDDIEEKSVIDSTKTDIDNIITDSDCTPIYLTESEKREFEEARISKNDTLEKSRLEHEAKLEKLKKEKDIAKEKLRISILQAPVQTSDLLSRHFQDVQNLENEYSIQKEILKQEFIREQESIKSAFVNDPNTKKNIEYTRYLIYMNKCEIQSKLNTQGIQEYNRLDQEQISLRIKLINKKNAELKKLERKKDLLLIEIQEQEKKTWFYGEFNEKKSKLLKKINEQKAQASEEYTEKQKDLFFNYNQRKEALLNNPQYAKK